MREKTKLSKNTKIFGIASFLNDFSSEMIFPLLPFFLTNILAAPVIVLGLLEGIAEFTTSVTGFFSGVYTDKNGKRKKVIIAGYALSGVMKSFFAFITTWQPAIAIRFLERFGKGLREAPRDAIIGLSEPKENLGNAIGFRRTLDNAGAIAGPLVATALLAYLLQFGEETAYRTIFIWAVIPAIFSVLVLFFIKDVNVEKKYQSFKEICDSALNANNFKTLIFAGMIFSLGQFSNAFFLLKSGEHMELIMVPVMYLAYNVVYTIFSMPAGRLADIYGAKKMIILAGFLFLATLVGFTYFSLPSTILILFFLLGLFMAIIETVPKTYILKNAEKETFATSVGVYGAAVGIAALPANLIAGVLWGVELFGTNATFIFSMITTIVALVIWIVKIKEN